MAFSDTRLTDVHRKTIQKCQGQLVNDLIMRSIIDDMYSKGVITDPMKEEIMSKPTNREQSRDFLDKLLTRDVAAFDDFIETLKRDNSHLFEIVKKQFHKLTFSGAAQHVALANEVDLKDLHDDNFAFAKKSVNEIFPMVQELTDKFSQFRVNDSDRIAKVADNMAGIDENVCEVQNEGLPQGLITSDQGSSNNRRPSIPGVVTQPESTQLVHSDSESESVQKHRQLERVSSTLDSVKIESKECNPRFRIIWTTAFFSNGHQVKVVTDIDGGTKAVLCDNQCNIISVLVEKSIVWHAICSPTNIAAVTCKPNDVAMVKLFDINGKNVKNIELPKTKSPSRLAFVNSGTSLLVADNENKFISQVHVESEYVQRRKHDIAFQSIEDMTVNDKNDLFVADCKAQSVKCFEESGRMIFDYNKESDDNDKFFPTSICIDSLGCVVITDTFNQNIKLLNSDGNLLKHLTKPENGLVNPISVTMNHKGQLIVITSVIKTPGVYIVTYRP